MLKSALSIILLCLLTLVILPINRVSDTALISFSGKSSGEFLYKKSIPLCNFFDIKGVTYTFFDDQALDFLEKLQDKTPVHFFSDGETNNYYFYIDTLPKSEIISGKKVNLHLAITGNKLTVGSPIIYYGY